MKKNFILLLLSLSVLKLSAQDFYDPKHDSKPAPPPPTNNIPNHRPEPKPHVRIKKPLVVLPTDSFPKFYIGIGSGINSYTGIIGIGADVRIYKSLLVKGGIGIGSWGAKTTIGLRFERKTTKGWVLGLAYAHCTGLKDYSTVLPVDSAGKTVNKEVLVDLLPASSINASASYQWVLGRHAKVFMEFGYAAAIEKDPFVVKDGSIITNDASATLNALTPGGLIIASGFMFGF